MSKIKIELKDVKKSFKSSEKDKIGVRALSCIDLTIYDGEIFSIVGPSGCGKTTLLNIIAGLVKPDHGCVLVNGEDVKGPGTDRGMCFQDFALFPWLTVAENIEFGPKVRGVPLKERKELVNRYTELVNLTDFKSRYPHELSGGMKQRCALARMLANNSDIWLMDEPLASADAQTRAILQTEILNIWETEKKNGVTHTIVYVTHNIEEAVFLSDRICVMTGRPSRIRVIIQDPLSRPRTDKTRSVREYGELRLSIWELIREEALEAIKAIH